MKVPDVMAAIIFELLLIHVKFSHIHHERMNTWT